MIEISQQGATVQLGVRIPRDLYLRLRKTVKGRHALGAAVASAISAYLDGQDVDAVAEAILQKLKERL